MHRPLRYKRNPVLLTLFSALLIGTTACNSATPSASGGDGTSVRLAQPLVNLSYLAVDTARAEKTFDSNGIKVDWALVSGGDSAILAALTAGDVQFGAVGTDAPLAAISKGSKYQMVYCLNSTLSQDVVVSNTWMQKAGVTPADPIEKRLQALKSATIGVSALGGLQDEEARYFIQLGGASPADAHIAKIGAPPALEAALKQGQIDAFILSPPEGAKMKASGVGQVLLSSSDVPQLKDFCGLALVVTKDYAAKHADVIRKVTAGLAQASTDVAQKPDQVAKTVHAAYYAQVAEPLVRTAVGQLAPALGGHGQMSTPMMSSVLQFVDSASGAKLSLDAAKGEGDWWTNQYLPNGQ